MFLFLKCILITKVNTYDYSTLSPIYTYPSIHFRKIDMTTNNSGGFIRFPHPLVVAGGGGDGMVFHDGGSYHLETSPLICRARIAKLAMKTTTAWKVSKYWVFSGPYFPAFGLNTEKYSVSLRIQFECGKIRTRKNSVFGHFHTVNISANNFFLKCLIAINFNRLCRLFRGFVLIIVIFYLNKKGRRRICHFDYKREVFPHV